MTWTAEAVEARLEEAADTLRRLPPGRRRPQLTSWPDTVRDPGEAYGYERTTVRPGPPPPGAISRLDEVLGWLAPVDPADRRILWARARGSSWRRIEDEEGRSAPTLRKAWRQALARLARRANGGALWKP